eukprot:TRINITY_DN16855_c0_g1_i2.p2 TRINITY_DN16855_c0_g1~~TRINITY_DN16855_c0_g1_i2.p2  ORF type:complete len:105 (+),score=5.84 TRINITY_DN16855_c0_g1_i2:557-871(+)
MPFVYDPSAAPKPILKSPSNPSRPPPMPVLHPWSPHAWLEPSHPIGPDVHRRVAFTLWTLESCLLPSDLSLNVVQFALSPSLRIAKASREPEEDRELHSDKHLF